jgi:hypothetical protein
MVEREKKDSSGGHRELRRVQQLKRETSILGIGDTALSSRLANEIDSST